MNSSRSELILNQILNNDCTKLLHIFNIVYEEGGVRKASKKLHTSVSAVSTNIAKLEHICKVKLFDRSRYRLIPNAIGSELYNIIKTRNDVLESAINHITRRVADTAIQLIRIACHPLAASCYTTQIIAHCVSIYTDIQFHVSIMKRSEALENLKKSMIDLVIYPMELSDILPYSDIGHFYTIGAYEICLFMHKDLAYLIPNAADSVSFFELTKLNILPHNLQHRFNSVQHIELNNGYNVFSTDSFDLPLLANAIKYKLGTVAIGIEFWHHCCHENIIKKNIKHLDGELIKWNIGIHKQTQKNENLITEIIKIFQQLILKQKNISI